MKKLMSLLLVLSLVLANIALSAVAFAEPAPEGETDALPEAVSAEGKDDASAPEDTAKNDEAVSDNEAEPGETAGTADENEAAVTSLESEEAAHENRVIPEDEGGLPSYVKTIIAIVIAVIIIAFIIWIH